MPSRVRLKRARTRLTDELGADWEGAKASFGRSFVDRQKYPPGHTHRVR